MTKVFFSVTMSLDGFIAPPGRLEEVQGPAMEVWSKQWSKDIRIGGGGETINEFLRAGLVDEFHLAVSPMFMGKGIRLLDGIDPETIEIRPLPAPASKLVTHLRYEVVRAREPAGPHALAEYLKSEASR